MKFQRKYLLLIPFAGTIAFAAVIGTGSTTNEVVSRRFDGKLVEKVLIENTSGKVTVTAGDFPLVDTTATKRHFTSRCTLTMETSEYSELIVRVEKPIGETCDVDLDIRVPAKVDLAIWSNSGAVQINGVQGKLTLNTGSGSVQANGKFTGVNLKSGSGAIDITGLMGGGDISLGSGPVSLKFLDNPKGLIDVKSGSGDAVLLFPKDTKLNAKLTTGSGDISNELPTSESAEFGVSVKAGAGDVRVKAY